MRRRVACRARRDQQPGDEAELAYRNVREFPDWYKPYTFNYLENGYFLAAIGFIALCKLV